ALSDATRDLAPHRERRSGYARDRPLPRGRAPAAGTRERDHRARRAAARADAALRDVEHETRARGLAAAGGAGGKLVLGSLRAGERGGEWTTPRRCARHARGDG